MSNQNRGTPIVSVVLPYPNEIPEREAVRQAELIGPDWVKAASYEFGDWDADVRVAFVHVYRQPISERPGEWRTRVLMTECQLGAIVCVPPAYPHGYVRAVVHTTSGGYFDTGTIDVHSGLGDKFMDFDLQVDGTFTNCEIFKQSWCDW